MCLHQNKQWTLVRFQHRDTTFRKCTSLHVLPPTLLNGILSYSVNYTLAGAGCNNSGVAMKNVAEISRNNRVSNILHPMVTVVAFFAFAGVDAAAQSEAPHLELMIKIDTLTGAFSAEARIEDPVGDVMFPPFVWLSVDAVTFAQSNDSIDVTLAADKISPDLHGGRDLRVTMSGTLPPPEQPIAEVAWSREAAYAVGAVWFPTDDVAIREHDVSVVVPVSDRIAATGLLISDTVTGDERLARYEFTGSSHDLGLFVGPYIVQETGHRDLRLRTYFEERNDELSSRYFEALAGYLDRYTDEVGQYPYDSFSVVSAPIPVGLGFAGLTYVSRDILGHPYMTGRSLAHEVLHSWWGNAVGVDYETGNWAEGLTTFQADYALAEDRGAEAARDMRIAWVRDLARLSDDRMLPLTAFRSSSHARDQSEGYGKAALIFHMLRDEIGEEPFGQGIRIFYAEKRNSIAGWDDLRDAFEEAAERDLGWFFAQWIERSGLPQIELVSADLAKAGNGSSVALTIRQEELAYRLRIPVIFEMMSGDVEKRIVEMDAGTTSVELALPGRPVAVRLDPDFDLARRPMEGELAPILRSIEGAGQIRAVDVSELGEARAMIAGLLSPMTGGTELAWQEKMPVDAPGSAVLVVGRSKDVAASRPPEFGPMPEVIVAENTRLWVERGADGRLWAFLSFADSQTLTEDLRGLRYYMGQSYVAFKQGKAVAAGVWPVPFNPAEVRFDTALESEATR